MKKGDKVTVALDYRLVIAVAILVVVLRAVWH